MPGPGHKKAKAKSKIKSNNIDPTLSDSIPQTPDAYVGNIDFAQDWNAIVIILCDVFEIPELTTRSGLKKVHANFDVIYKRLEKACSKYPDDTRIVGGIIGIYAKMCADSILRNKLFERGLLSKLMSLLSIDFTRHMALRCLGTVTHHGGVPIRLEIAKHASVLTGLIEQFPDDCNIAELGVTTLAHSVGAALEGDRPANPTLLASLDLRTILKVVTESTRKEWASSYLINHAMGLLATATLHALDVCKGYPPMIKFLVAGLRSKDWVTRCTCLGGIIRLHRHESVFDEPTLDPMKFVACIQRGFSSELQDLMVDYGPMGCDTFLTLKTSRDYQQAMMACAQDHNIYSLGLKLAEFILRTEF